MSIAGAISEKARRATVWLIYGNTDITGDISDILESFSYKDCAEGESDSISIAIDAAGDEWKGSWMPDKGAKLISGFAKEITPKEYKERVHDGTFAEVLQTCNIQPGDVFYVPAGRVHGIGAGAFVAEIQQTSDITYRIFDYNRKDKNGKTRELHTAQAVDAINFSDVQDDFRTAYDHVQNEPVEVVACPYFTTSVYDMTEEISCDYSELDSFVIFICVEGSCRLIDNEKNEISLQAGETVLLPATVQEVTIVPEKAVKLLETYV